MKKDYNYNSIIFSSGGIYGITFIGVYSYLYNHNLLNNIINYYGCSVGSIFAFFACINHDPKDLYQFAMDFEYNNYSDINLLNLASNYGFESGDKIINAIKTILYNNLNINNISFKELYILTNKKLHITATNLNDHIIEYFNVDMHPDMDVLTAIRMSISIPIIFSPVSYNNKLYVDGGLLEQVPQCIEPALIFKILHIKQHTDNNINTLEEYCANLLSCMIINLNKDTIKENQHVIEINIHNMNIYTFDLTLREKKRLFKIGYRATRTFHNNIHL